MRRVKGHGRGMEQLKADENKQLLSWLSSWPTPTKMLSVSLSGVGLPVCGSPQSNAEHRMLHFSPREYVDHLDSALNLSVLLSETWNQNGMQLREETGFTSVTLECVWQS